MGSAHALKEAQRRAAEGIIVSLPSPPPCVAQLLSSVLTSGRPRTTRAETPACSSLTIPTMICCRGVLVQAAPKEYHCRKSVSMKNCCKIMPRLLFQMQAAMLHYKYILCRYKEVLFECSCLALKLPSISLRWKKQGRE